MKMSEKLVLPLMLNWSVTAEAVNISWPFQYGIKDYPQYSSLSEMHKVNTPHPYLGMKEPSCKT